MCFSQSRLTVGVHYSRTGGKNKDCKKIFEKFSNWVSAFWRPPALYRIEGVKRENCTEITKAVRTAKVHNLFTASGNAFRGRTLVKRRDFRARRCAAVLSAGFIPAGGCKWITAGQKLSAKGKFKEDSL